MIKQYTVPTIPDVSHHRLVALSGGDVRGCVFRGQEQLLRMLANFDCSEIAFSYRMLFDPGRANDTQRLQERLRVQVAVRVDDALSTNLTKQLIENGPLAEFYEFQNTSGIDLDQRSLGEYNAVCEVLKQEEAIEPLVSRAENDRIPSLYYALFPFEPREDNAYLAIDRLLSKMHDACAVELLVQPMEHEEDLAAHYRYITHLMSINAYYDDFADTGPGSEPWSNDSVGSQVLTRQRRKDPIADDILREHQDLHRNLRQPQLLFQIKAFAARAEDALLLASTVAESGLQAGKYQLVTCDGAKGSKEQSAVRRSLEASREMRVDQSAMYSRVWDRTLPRNWQGLKRLCRLATVDELKGLMRLPVGGFGSPCCIPKTTDPSPIEPTTSILIGDDLESQPPGARNGSDDLNDLFECKSVRNLELRLGMNTLTKHMFVAGVPGSGKTTAVFNLLVQLFRHDVPFLVIEPAKTEYRILKTLHEHPDPTVRAMAERVRVYTPGNEQCSPLRFNPLAFPEGISVDEHMGQVLASFEAAMPMGGPLQALLAEAVEAVYDGREQGDFPRMQDLVGAAQQIMGEKQYEGEVRSNLQAAIEVRLGLLTRRAIGRIFECYDNIPNVAELLAHPTIIELDYLSQDHACLLTLLLLSAIREEIRVNPQRRQPGLHHITVIEEAHNIVGRSGPAKASEDTADPKAFAAQYVSRMLAELRALGEGIIIADQLPSTVAPEVVKNTGTKLAHRLVSIDDREELGGAMLLGSTETEEIARLSPGEAYFYTEGLHLPRRVRCLNANAYLKLGPPPSGLEILQYMCDDAWHLDCQERRAMTVLDVLLLHIVELYDAIADGASQAAVILTQDVPLATVVEDPAQRVRALNAAYAKLLDVAETLTHNVEIGFVAKIWTPRKLDIQDACERFPTVSQRMEDMIVKCENGIWPKYEAVIEEIRSGLNQIQASIGL